jgi:hypothetical protein
MNKFIAIAMGGAALTCATSATNAAVTLTASSITAVYSNAPTADLHKTNNPSITDDNVKLTPQILKGTLSSNPGVPVEFFAYCVDVFQVAGPTTFQVTSLLDYLGGNAAKANQISALMVAEGAQTSRLHDAAVQLAVWELVNETLGFYDIDKYTQTVTEQYRDSKGRLKTRTVTTTPGQFWADDVKSGSGVLASADAMLGAASANAGNSFDGYSFFVAKSATKQDFLFWTYTPPMTAVPEPASWAMMILGMGLVGSSMRRNRRTKTAVSFA